MYAHMKFRDIVDKTVQILEQAPEELGLPPEETPGMEPIEPGSALPVEPEVDPSQINEGKLALIELARKAFLSGLYFTSSSVEEIFQDPADYGVITSKADPNNMTDIQDILNYLVRDFYPDTDID
jgi:hypothetical protein